MSGLSGRRGLHRLIYASRQCVTPAALRTEVAAILQASVRNNARDGVSGLLLTHDGWFVQALEGPPDAVMTTYGRILNDRRHEGSVVLSAGPAAHREFGDWAMCAHDLSATDAEILRVLGARGTFNPEALTASAALRLLTTLRSIQKRTQTA